MIRDFSREELQPTTSNDTELTLGLGTILGLAGGLVLLCVICFAAGYAVGHRAPANQDTSVLLSTPSPSASSVGTGTKPGAHGQPAASSTPIGDSEDQAMLPRQATTEAASDPASSNAAATPTGSHTDGQVQPALQSSTNPQSAPPLRVQPATTQTDGWMVQIAAVSRTEDADVLIGALRKRGYAVTARREIGDNLIHVQTGPFVNRNDANSMRQKLLSDGYNAIVQ
jgi:DedD protein